MKQILTKYALLHEDKIKEYERIHDEIPKGIVKSITERGITELRIFRQGTFLVMFVEIDKSTEVMNRTIDEALRRKWEEVTQSCFKQSWRELPEIFTLSDHY